MHNYILGSVSWVLQVSRTKLRKKTNHNLSFAGTTWKTINRFRISHIEKIKNWNNLKEKKKGTLVVFIIVASQTDREDMEKLIKFLNIQYCKLVGAVLWYWYRHVSSTSHAFNMPTYVCLSIAGTSCLKEDYALVLPNRTFGESTNWTEQDQYNLQGQNSSSIKCMGLFPLMVRI